MVHRYVVGDKVVAVFGDETVGVIVALSEPMPDEASYLVDFGFVKDDFLEEELEPAENRQIRLSPTD